MGPIDRAVVEGLERSDIRELEQNDATRFPVAFVDLVLTTACELLAPSGLNGRFHALHELLVLVQVSDLNIEHYVSGHGLHQSWQRRRSTVQPPVQGFASESL